MGAARYVEIDYNPINVQLSYLREDSNHEGDSGDPYTGYDRFGRTVDMRWVNTTGNGTTLDRIQYGYGPAGNRTWRKNLAALNGGQDNAWNYDGLYQVKDAALGTLNLNQTAIGGIPTEEQSFAYDPTGNWTHTTRAADGADTLDQSRVSNRDNQMTQVDGSSDGIAYDAAGNATKTVPDKDGDWSRFYRLTWDAWNRLIEVRDDSGDTGALIASYAYDGTFRRTTKSLPNDIVHSYYYNDQWKVVEERTSYPSSSSSSSSISSSSSSPSSSSSSPSSSSYSSSSYSSSSSPVAMAQINIVASSSSSSSSSSPSSSSSSSSSGQPSLVTTQYVWGARPNHRDELILRDRDTNNSGSYDQRFFCLMDYFNPTSLVNSSGQVVERYRFTPFGQRTVMTSGWSTRENSQYEFEFGYQGQFEDPESSYYNYGFRYYEAQSGRFINRDPIEERGGVNLYAFALNNGVNAVDRLGLKRYKLKYDMTADAPMFFGVRRAKSFPEIRAEVEKKATPYGKDGKNPCNCIEELVILIHGGPGSISPNGAVGPSVPVGNHNTMMLEDFLDAANRQNEGEDQSSIDSDYPNIASFREISEHMCEGGKLELVACKFAKGPRGDEAVGRLEEFFGAGNVIAQERNCRRYELWIK